jgi:hypothetical protein
MPWAMSNSLSRRFSSAKASLSLEVAANVSLRRITSCSRALMYSSFLSRCVLAESQLHSFARCTAEITSVPADLAPVAVLRLACCLVWDLSFSVVDHLILISYAQVAVVINKPRVVFFSVRLLKKPNCANGLFDSLPIDCHCPVLSMSDAKPAKLPLLLLPMLISEKHSEGRREAAGEGYSLVAPAGG